MEKEFAHFSAEQLEKVARLELRVRTVVEGLLTGLHSSPRRGYNVEFLEHRPYTPGDDLRHVDWKLFGKSDRYSIKQSADETNLRAFLLLDTSASMFYRGAESEMSKVDYASFLAACLSYLLIKQGDAAGLVTFDRRALHVVEPRASRPQLYRILAALEEQRQGGVTDLAAVLDAFSERVRRRGLVVLISDLLDDPPAVFAALRVLRGRRNEVVLFHVLDADEENFPFTRAARFVDVEGGMSITAEPAVARREYRRGLEHFRAEYAVFCRRAGIEFIPALSSEPVEAVLLRFLMRRGRRKRR